MKTHVIFFLLFGFVIGTFAQNIDKQVVASAGNTSSNANYQLTSTIGEPIIGLKGSSVSINQGFLAGATNDATLSVEELVESESVKIYPNPVTDFVNISIPDNNENIRVTIYSATGKQVGNYTMNNALRNLDLSHLSSGMYLVQLDFKDAANSKTFKIIKK
ncbi:T9SS type A sorting domain-containing protein [Bizionia algoritergicola]|uniref:T9SS type A sorting domain-containing protein n=1 Tax=Bizionia algoritergicola TaxID=291187 RepID=A0A5D0R1K4_9FLAO|nr:T9SS type A sorting domain-containing protein [Bizionia algoritergicola]TYB75403.1 T9SS type A sorting domain-containing protein [Bizionia algoritergicola]